MSQVIDIPSSMQATLAGRYALQGWLGRGGMGIVYAAADSSDKRDVAVKVLRKEFSDNESVNKRLNREMRATARINHPNVVRLLDHGYTHEGRQFVVFERVNGRSLKDEIVACGRLDFARIARIGAGIARGLAAAHRAGVVHRDLKPGNVMLEEGVDGADCVRLLDFGIATFTRPEDEQDREALTRAGMRVGTPEFMAPEQFESDQAVDGRADLYSLGIVLFAMTTGRVPFKFKSATRTAVAHIESPVTPPSHLRPEMPSELEAVILRLLEKNPADRFQTGDDAATALLEAVGLHSEATAPPAGRTFHPPEAAAETLSELDPSIVVGGLLSAALATLVLVGAWVVIG